MSKAFFMDELPLRRLGWRMTVLPVLALTGLSTPAESKVPGSIAGGPATTVGTATRGASTCR